MHSASHEPGGSGVGSRATPRTGKRRGTERTPLLPKVAVQRGLKELELVVDVFKTRYIRQCALCCVAAFFWPICVFGALALLPFVLTKAEWVDRFGLMIVVGACATVYFFIPGVCVALRGSKVYFDMLEHSEIEIVEVGSFCASFVIILFLICYAWVVFESLTLEVQLSLQSRSEFLAKFWKEPMHMPPEEAKLCFGDDRPKYIDDLIQLLKSYPGWKGHFEIDQKALADIGAQRDKAAGQTHPIHHETPRDEHTPNRQLDAIVVSAEHDSFGAVGANAFSMKVTLFLRWLLLESSIGATETAAILVIALARVFIPRLWVHVQHGRPFFPHNPVDALFVISLMLGTFFAASLWFILLENTRVEYSHNVNQMLLVSALASHDYRHQYLRDMLEVEEDSGSVKARELPLLDMTRASNVRVWWALREFAIVDSLDERIALELVVSAALLYQFSIILYCIIELFLAGGVTAFTAVSVFDLTFLSALVMLVLLTCVEVNSMLQSHESTILRARQQIWSPESKRIGLSLEEQQEFVEEGQDDEEHQREVLRLHNHLIEKVRHADTLQKLFGVEVTMDNVIQFIVAVLCGVGASSRYFTQ